ncbi:hypothetical protein S40285_10303 [Stachybotrys chlorohalonatus IBT 40285]|uniref:Uncharacterized protein n=1 Tax=Stachybotrys chlorohalonatus (strain IBT 40285) TaxID=1283841 RepID=A0A084QX29_STAC4|nr:hypothetical protein S40285_10303 [Stachybotrys chlorohalonata IBT 40285]
MPTRSSAEPTSPLETTTVASRPADKNSSLKRHQSGKGNPVKPNKRLRSYENTGDVACEAPTQKPPARTKPSGPPTSQTLTGESQQAPILRQNQAKHEEEHDPSVEVETEEAGDSDGEPMKLHTSRMQGQKVDHPVRKDRHKTKAAPRCRKPKAPLPPGYSWPKPPPGGSVIWQNRAAKVYEEIHTLINQEERVQFMELLPYLVHTPASSKAVKNHPLAVRYGIENKRQFLMIVFLCIIYEHEKLVASWGVKRWLKNDFPDWNLKETLLPPNVGDIPRHKEDQPLGSIQGNYHTAVADHSNIESALLADGQQPVSHDSTPINTNPSCGSIVEDDPSGDPTEAAHTAEETEVGWKPEAALWKQKIESRLDDHEAAVSSRLKGLQVKIDSLTTHMDETQTRETVLPSDDDPMQEPKSLFEDILATCKALTNQADDLQRDRYPEYGPLRQKVVELRRWMDDNAQESDGALGELWDRVSMLQASLQLLEEQYRGSNRAADDPDARLGVTESRLDRLWAGWRRWFGVR